LENATFEFEMVDGSVYASGLTDLDGVLTVRLPRGVYAVSVYYDGVNVNSTLLEVVSDGMAEFSCAVYYLEIKAIDYDGLVLSNVEIVVESESKIRSYIAIDGNATIKLPIGEYEIKLYWLGVLVNESEYLLNENAPIEIICKVRKVTFMLIDDLGYSLSDAQVEIYSNETDSKILYSIKSGTDGKIDARLPESEVTLKVSWKNVEVANEKIYVNSSEYTIKCAVIYARFIPIDEKGMVINGAQIIVHSSVGVLGSESCNETYSEMKLPVGEWVVVVRWLGIEVANKTILIDNSNDYIINCSVIYAKIKPLDMGNNVLTKSYISVYSQIGNLASGECNSETLELRIPVGSWHVSIIWKGVEVANGTISFNETKVYEITCSVIYVNVKPVDSRGSVLKSAQITVYSNDSLLAAEECGTDGIVVKLPVGEWRIIVTWLGEKVADTRKTINAGEITIDCSVSYLTVKTKDNNGASLDCVSVSVYSEDGRLLGYADTKNGKAELRIRNGQVVIKGKLSNEYMLSHVERTVKKESNLVSDSEIVLKFDYPPAIYSTNLFAITVLGLLAACATSFALYLILRKEKEGTEVDEKGKDLKEDENKDKKEE
jgi:hypothetical protein